MSAISYLRLLLLRISSFFIKYFDISYALSVLFVMLSIYSGLASEYFLRQITSLGVDASTVMFIRFTSTTVILYLILLFSRSNTKPSSIKASLLRALLLTIGGYLWNFGIILSKMQLPIYMTSFIGLSVPIFVTIFSKILLNEKIYERMPIIVISGTLLLGTLSKYIFYDKFYPVSIVLVLLGCVLYALFDTLNIYVLSGSRTALAPNFIEMAKKDGIFLQMLYSSLFCSIFSIIFLAFKIIIGSVDIATEKEILTRIVLSKIPIVALIGICSISMTGFILLAFKTKGGSSVQYVKIFEPIMAGAFNEKSIPRDIIFTIAILFITSICNFCVDIRHKKENL